MIRTFVETPTVRRVRYIFVAALFLALMVLVHGGAEVKAWLDIRGPAAAAHTAAYYRVIFSIWATDDYTPAVYNQAGIDWIDNNNMTTVLLRHLPELTPILQPMPNAFAPWQVR